MATSKKPRKKYKKRHVMLNPVEWVIAGISPPDQNAIQKVRLINHGAMKAMVDGTATREEWETLSTALNVSVILAEQGIGSAYLLDLKDAITAHAFCGKRLMETGRAGYNGQQLTAMNLALEVHDAQLDAITVSQMEKAFAELKRRLDTKDFITVKEATCTS